MQLYRVMALFPRRVIDRCLNESRTFASEQKLRDWVRRLNTVSDDYVATEWELVLLNAFAKCGRVQHEPSTHVTPLDLLFESVDGSLAFAADIATISDQEMHRRNPVDSFQEQLCKRIARSTIKSGRFSFTIEEEQPVAARGTGRRRHLLLPRANQLSTHVFNADFDSFMERVRAQPHLMHDYAIKQAGPAIRISIQYAPGIGRSVFGYYGAYTATTVKNKNPLFNALKRKADQLRRSGYQGLRGIIICDGGAQILSQMPKWATYTPNEVIRDFFRQNRSIEFVITIALNRRCFGSGNDQTFEYNPQLFVRSSAPAWTQDLGCVLADVMSCLPEPSRTPENATNSLKWNRSTRMTAPYIGGWELKGNQIKISSRELLDLLAGRLDQKRFCENHTSSQASIFTVFRNQGKMIQNVRVERQEDRDDDWIVFQFSNGDPATSDFRVPEAPDSPGD